MRRPFRMVSTVFTAVALVGAIGLSSSAFAGDSLEEGKKISFNKKKGNCLACHLIAGGTQSGNIAPPLVAMKARFPDRAVLLAQISDAQAKNPDSMMPPFKAHGILSPKELDLVTDYIHSL